MKVHLDRTSPISIKGSRSSFYSLLTDEMDNSKISVKRRLIFTLSTRTACMQSTTRRLNTYYKWNEVSMFWPKYFAEAGFFLRDGHVVSCYQCGLELCATCFTRFPMEVHSLLMPYCEFILKQNGKI